MTDAYRRRRRRRKLAAHDRGEDRHNPGLALLKKQGRLSAERPASSETPARTRARKLSTLTVAEPEPVPRCQRKTRRHSPEKCFATEALAELMCGAVLATHGKRLTAYRCPHADHWHVTAAAEVAA